MPNRVIAEYSNRGKIGVDGVPRGRADTPGFYRQPEIKGQQVTEFGVPPLPRKNTQQEARIFGEGFLLFLARRYRSAPPMPSKEGCLRFQVFGMFRVLFLASPQTRL